MCGQAGLIIGRKRRSIDEVEILQSVFSGLLAHSEARGRHASGLAVVTRYGDYRLCKRAMPATELIRQAEYHNVLDSFEPRHGRHAGRTTLVLGHTRYRTRGSESNNFNNHPLRAADWIGTANGTIYNAEALFDRHRLYRHAQVDSELVLRLAEKFSDTGRLNLTRFLSALRAIRGQLSAVFTSLCAPHHIYLIHGNRPLHLRAHRRYRVLAYASDPRFLDDVIGDLSGWRDFALPAMTLARFHSDRLFQPRLHTIHFTRQEPARVVNIPIQTMC